MGGTQTAHCQRKFELDDKVSGRPPAMVCRKTGRVLTLAVICFFLSATDASARIDPCDVYADCSDSGAGGGGFLGTVVIALLALFVAYQFFNSKEFRGWTYVFLGGGLALAYAFREIKASYGTEVLLIFGIIAIFVIQKLCDRHFAKKESEKKSRQELEKKINSNASGVLLDKSKQAQPATPESKTMTFTQVEVLNAELRPRANPALSAAEQATREAESAAKGVATWKAKWGEDPVESSAREWVRCSKCTQLTSVPIGKSALCVYCGVLAPLLSSTNTANIAIELAKNSNVEVRTVDTQKDSYWVQVHAANEAKRLADLRGV